MQNSKTNENGPQKNLNCDWGVYMLGKLARALLSSTTTTLPPAKGQTKRVTMRM